MNIGTDYRTGSIDDLVDVTSMTMEGVVPVLYPHSRTSPPRLVFPDKTVILKESIFSYLEFLFKYGYGKRSEFWQQFHAFSENYRSVDWFMKRVRSVAGIDGEGKSMIRTRYGSGEYEGGYFIGNLAQHRNDPDNLVKSKYFSLNIITGCLQMEGAEDPVFMTPLQTEVLFWFIGIRERSVLGNFLNSEVLAKKPTERDSVASVIREINRKISPLYKIASAQYGTFSYRLQRI